MVDTLNLIVLSSELRQISNEELMDRESIPVLNSLYGLNIITIDDIKEFDQERMTAIFIATGGTEEQFLKIVAKIPKPVIVVSDSFGNSLAASMEISSWLSSNKVIFKHINIPADPSRKFIEELSEELNYLAIIQTGLNKLKNFRIGLIGGESPWLISSAINREYVSKYYGATFVDIDESEIENRYLNSNTTEAPEGTKAVEATKAPEATEAPEGTKAAEATEAPEGTKAAEATKAPEAKKAPEATDKEMLKKFESHLDSRCVNETHLTEALKLYDTLYRHCVDNRIDAFTIKCFHLINSCKTTACLALSLLNDRKIVAGCEGDIPSLWSMIVANILCDSQSFMSNPSSVERIDHSVDFAHCSAPLSLSEDFILTSHYESGKGIGIKAGFKLGKYTLFKCGGANLDKFYLFEGDVVQNTSVKERCRTQIKFIFKSEDHLDEFLNSNLGNHAILIPGKHKKILSRFIKLISHNKI